MKPAPFEYHAPATLAEALELLAVHGDNGKLLAGGQSLIPALNMRLAQPGHLIDINHLSGLAGVSVQGAGPAKRLRIGALTKHADVAAAPLVREYLPIMAEAARHLGHYVIRQQGTFGGSLCHADPAAEWPLLAMLLDAELHIAAKSGTRRIAARDFFQSVYTTALAEHELLLHADLDMLEPDEGWAYAQISRRSGDFAIVAAAVTIRLNNGKISAARLALGGVSDRPVRLIAQEQACLGAVPGAGWAAALSADAADKLQEVNDDMHAPAEYRRELVRFLLAKALGDALLRIRGEQP